MVPWVAVDGFDVDSGEPDRSSKFVIRAHSSTLCHRVIRPAVALEDGVLSSGRGFSPDTEPRGHERQYRLRMVDLAAGPTPSNR